MLTHLPWFTHYAGRRLEWLLAFYTVFFGAALMMPAASMSTATFTGALFMLPEWGWGLLYVVVGLMHISALHINGRAAWTPFARFVALFLNSQVFLALALSLAPSNPWGTGVLTYGFISVGFCGAAIYAAGQDCGREIKTWKARRHGQD